jgi:hypothetical protein
MVTNWNRTCNRIFPKPDQSALTVKLQAQWDTNLKIVLNFKKGGPSIWGTQEEYKGLKYHGSERYDYNGYTICTASQLLLFPSCLTLSSLEDNRYTNISQKSKHKYTVAHLGRIL